MVNTFLPYASFERSAQALDNRRLGKQRVECDQIIKLLLGIPTLSGKPRTGWKNHSAVRMWRGYERALMRYMDECVIEWIRRGKKNTYGIWVVDEKEEIVMPPWFGDERVHSSHRKVLLFKEPEWYGKFGWSELPAYEYFWPVPLVKQ